MEAFTTSGAISKAVQNNTQKRRCLNLTRNSKSLLTFNFAIVIVFVYFLTLPMDLINVDVGFFKLKISHVAGMATFVLFAIGRRGILIEKRFFFCFACILASMLISSFCSAWIFRSIAYSFILAFTFFSYFFVTLNVMQCFDEEKIIKIYNATYLIIGSYAALQFFCSLVDIILPFSVQKLVIVRGSALALEPSFYALYAIPFVTFLNSRWLLSKVYAKNDSKPKRQAASNFICLCFANLFLLVSTTTSAFVSYFVFIVVVLCLKRRGPNQLLFSGLRKKLLKVSLSFFALFALMGCLLVQLLRETFLKFLYYGLKHESFHDRFKGIIASFGVFLENPFWGVGLGGVGPYLFQKEFFPGYSGQITDIDRLSLEKFEPTNVLTEVLASMGIAGFAAFSLLIILIWRSFRKALDNQRLLPLERINLLSFFISILVMLICLQINQGLFRGYVWVHLGLGVGYVMKINGMLKNRPV